MTQLQSLPFGALRWDEFERLCLRLARLDHEMQVARRYGIPGQDQSGIDLYARRTGTGEYTVYQCKKVDRFGPASIETAVDRFLAGPWAERAARFVLCASVSFAPTQLAERLEQERDRLAERGVAFEVLDADELDMRLKDLPRLVDDFFGRPAVTAFCGPDVAARLGQRLDGGQVAEYRRRLQRLYATVFAQYDPGLPVPPQISDTPVDLRRRYVVPDVGEAMQSQPVADSAPGGAPTDRPPLPLAQANALDGPSGSPTQSGGPVGDAGYRLRQPLGTWLAAAQRGLLVGGTGSGKSTTLRFVTLDLLDADPLLADVAAHWGDRLPVWVSFPFWTGLIAREPEGVSLPDCVRRWLTVYGHEVLWPLVAQALTDDRLLLIVDGLDEWASEDAARTAAHLLQVYVQARDIPVLAAGRPHGVRRLELQGGQWNVAEIAELDADQQREIVRVWVRLRLAASDGPQPAAGEGEGLVDEESGRFIDQVRAVADLGKLAQNPMLLMLLLYLHLRHSELPRSRFEAYEKVVEHLIADHPAARRRAAMATATTAPLQPNQARHALAYLAYRLQHQHPEGDITDVLAAQYVERALGSADESGLGLPTELAAQTAASLLTTAEDGFGLLVRASTTTLRFFHRAVQEHLAAVHITRLPPDQQRSLVAEVGTDPRWEPTVLSLLWLAPRPSEVEALVNTLPATAVGPAGEQRDRIRAEVAFGQFDTAPTWAQTVAVQVVTAVEREERLAHRGQLLDRMLAGIQDPRTSGLVNDAVLRWIYDRAVVRPSTLAAIASWPRTPTTWHILTVALNDSDDEVQRAAGSLIPRVYAGDEQVKDFLLAAVRSSQRPATRAAALDALTRGWPGEPAIDELVAQAHGSIAVEQVIAAIDTTVRRGVTTDDDFEQLVSAVSGDRPHPSGAWLAAVPEILAAGWTHSQRLRDLCLEGAARDHEFDEGIQKSVATMLLAVAFPGDDQVATWIAGELDHNPHPFLMARHYQTWRNIAKNFRDHPTVVAAALRWIPRQQFDDPEASLLALVSRTDRMRDLLVRRLDTATVPHWPAESLLEGWGMQDPAVAEALRGFLGRHPPAESSQIAHLLPRIIEEPDQARAALLAMLRPPNVMRPDFVVIGLARLADPGDVTEIVDAAQAHPRGLFSTLVELIVGFPQHPRVRELALAALDEHDAPVHAVAYAYGHDPDLAPRVAKTLTPIAPPLRARIIDTLARRPLSDTTTTALLERFDVERHGEVKLLAATAWARRIRHDPDATARAVERLTGLVQTRGPDHQERRRAAFAALLVLGRADVFVDLREQQGGPVRVSPDLLHRETEFLRLVAEHWTTLTDLLGDQLTTRLSPFGEPTSFWTAICTVAVAYPTIHPAVLGAIDTNRQVATSIQALRFVATVRAGTPRLLDQLIAVIDAADGPRVSAGDLERAIFAADTIAHQFGGAPDVAARLVARTIDRWDLGRTAALCRGWPDHPVVQAVERQITPTERTWADREVRYARLPAGQLVAQLRYDLDRMTQLGRDISFLVVGALSARLRRDPDSLHAFEEALTPGTDPVMKAAIPSALSIAGTLTPTVADWCEAEIKRQTASGNTDVGLDLRTATVRGVTATLVDALQGPTM